MLRTHHYRQDKHKLNPCDYHIHLTDEERKKCQDDEDDEDDEEDEDV
jgi:hypothetical protein